MYSRPLTVGISAEFNPHCSGGVASVVSGLLRALGRLEDGDERYKIIVSQAHLESFRSFETPNIELVHRDPLPDQTLKFKFFHRMLRRSWRVARKHSENLEATRPTWPSVPISDGFYESLGCHVLHFPHQSFVVTAIPTIYNPHDLQHLHLPHFFAPRDLALRETVYPFGCRMASAVAVASSWVKEDLVRAYGLNRQKIRVIPWAPPTEAFATPSAMDLLWVRQKYNLPETFAFYPAVTWPHKNHSRLIDAVAHLRRSGGPAVSIVCCGTQLQPHFDRLQLQARDQGVSDLVLMLGRIPGEDVKAIFRLATCCIVPTLFEAASAPVFESWEAGTPVACSAVTSLPSQVGDAGLLFNPCSTVEIANALKHLMTQPESRTNYAERGRRRLEDFCWTRTAKAYRALYRQVAQQHLTDEDQRLLHWNWMEQSDPSEIENVEC